MKDKIYWGSYIFGAFAVLVGLFMLVMGLVELVLFAQSWREYAHSVAWVLLSPLVTAIGAAVMVISTKAGNR